MGARPPGMAAFLSLALWGRAQASSCDDLGFSPSLLCTACTKLADVIGEGDPLVADCQRCCSEEAAQGTGRYARAVLEVCK